MTKEIGGKSREGGKQGGKQGEKEQLKKSITLARLNNN